MEHSFKNKKFAIVVSLFCMILWGSAVPLIKSTYAILQIGADDIGGKMLVAGIRFFFAGLLGLAYFLLLDREKAHVKNLTWHYVLVLSLLQTSIQYLFYYVGLSHTMGVKASIIQASNAFFVVILSALILKNDRITSQRVLSLLIGTAGILVVNFQAGSEMSFHWNGEGAILAATIFNALATVYVRKNGQNQNPALATGLQFLVGSLPLIAIGWVIRGQFLTLNLKAVLMLLYGAFVSATAFTLWSMVLKHQNSGEFGVYKLFIPIFGSVFSVLILKEAFTMNLLIGMILVLTGSLILNRKPRKVQP